MKLRRRYVLLAALLGVASATLPAIASSETTPVVEAVNTVGSGIYAEERHSWSPTQVSVGAGGVVTFSNSSNVPHGIEWRSALKPTCEEGAGKVPVGTTASASGTKWSGNCTFSQAGTYTFYCTVHGPEMTGTITVNPNGTTTTTMTETTPTNTSTTPAPKEGALTGPLFIGAPLLPSSQHGGSVHGSLDVSQAGAGLRLQVELFANSKTLTKAKHGKPVLVGRYTRSSTPAGQQAFTAQLSAQAKRALKRGHRLALTVKIVLTPLHGEPITVSRTVVEHA